MNDSRPTFSGRAVAWLLAIGLLSFAGAAYFMATSESREAERSAGSNSYSVSALGHKAFAETLRRLEIPVLVSRGQSALRAGDQSLLVIAEPLPSAAAGVASGDGPVLFDLAGAAQVLVFLPKWQGIRDTRKPQWIAAARLQPLEQVEAVLAALDPSARLVRVEGEIEWRRNPFGVIPDLASPQLMTSDHLQPVLSGPQGMLVGELRDGDRRIWIVSDPDLISNHGLGRSDNAILAVLLVEDLRPPGGSVIIDETVHGFRAARSLLLALFEFPYVVATLQFAVAVVILLWAATARFGAPLPARRALVLGKVGLVENTARLLHSGGHARELLRRYLSATIRDAGRRLHAPRRADPRAQIDWLDRVGRSRGAAASLGDLERKVATLLSEPQVSDGQLLEAAQSLYSWKQEIVHGSGSHPIRQPSPEGADR